jgi:hypothetical protein
MSNQGEKRGVKEKIPLTFDTLTLILDGRTNVDPLGEK